MPVAGQPRLGGQQLAGLRKVFGKARAIIRQRTARIKKCNRQRLPVKIRQRNDLAQFIGEGRVEQWRMRGRRRRQRDRAYGRQGRSLAGWLQVIDPAFRVRNVQLKSHDLAGLDSGQNAGLFDLERHRHCGHEIRDRFMPDGHGVRRHTLHDAHRRKRTHGWLRRRGIGLRREGTPQPDQAKAGEQGDHQGTRQHGSRIGQPTDAIEAGLLLDGQLHGHHGTAGRRIGKDRRPFGGGQIGRGLNEVIQADVGVEGEGEIG